jgi:tetratricopeptide (TPR) repeat protein
MNKAVSSFLAVSAFLAAPGALPHFASGFAQTPAPASGQVSMDQAEYAVYDNAMNKQTTPQTQAPALEAYLQQYPKSSVKNAVLERIMVDYSQFDLNKALTAADNVLQVSPSDFAALTIESVARAQTAMAATDAATKQAGLDSAASYAQKALAAPKPADMSDSDFQAQKTRVAPTFYSTIANDFFAKKDYPDAIAAFKQELAAAPPASTQTPGTTLQDIYYLAQAYYSSTPPDYIDCTFYATRAAVYAGPYAAQLQPLASYCYKKYHGKADGYDAVTAAAKANLNPPAGFSITPAPSDADIAAQTVASTPDLATLAIQDKEFILANGTQLDPKSGTVDPATGKKDPATQKTDADEVFDSVKGKEDKLPDATVISATSDDIQVAFSDDAVQSKTADFTFKMKTPLKTPPPFGTKITLIGIWGSYTQKPLMITMTDGEEYKAAVKKAPVHTPVHHH